MEPTTAAPTNLPLHDTYLTERQLAEELPDGSVRKLRRWRSLRLGPKWLRIGRAVVYLRSSVDEWLRSSELMIERKQRPPARRRSR
jgi:hypothetical protein